MIGDLFTKPLQGSLFIKMRNYVMRIEEPGYQALPSSVLSIHDTTGIRKQKIYWHSEVQLGSSKNGPQARDHRFGWFNQGCGHKEHPWNNTSYNGW